MAGLAGHRGKGARVAAVGADNGKDVLGMRDRNRKQAQSKKEEPD